MASIASKCCRKCRESKSIEEFYNQAKGRDGRQSTCKSCQNVVNSAWRDANRERVNNSRRRWRKNNPDKVKAASRAWWNNNPEYGKIRFQEHREEIYAYARHRRKTDPEYYLRRRIAELTSQMPKRKYHLGSIELLGCTPAEYRLYLENQFLPGMSWENRSEWHIDHVIPLSAFDLNVHSELLEACNYLNTQPLWAQDNLRKHSKTPKGFHV